MKRTKSATASGDTTPELPSTFASSEDQSPWRRRFGSIHQALRQRITTLEYAPGIRLDIDQLSEEFGVSRTPVRNVLQRLDLEGLVRTRHGVGTIVAPLDLDHIRQAVRMRIELASLIGKFRPEAIATATGQKLHQVSLHMTDLADSDDPILFAHIDMRVHDAICGLVGNPLLRRVYDEMYFRTARLRISCLADQSWAQEVSTLARDVELILDAMERDDLDGIGALVGNSIHDTFARIDALVTERGGRSSGFMTSSS